MNGGYRDGVPLADRRPTASTTARQAAPDGPAPRERTGRVEARNRLVGRNPPEAFDFTVEDTGDDPALGILATYLGVAACEQSRTLGRGIDVYRVLVEAERQPMRSDGGAHVSGRGVTDATEQRRVRAVVEVRTATSTGVCGVLGDRLGADRVPFSIVPDLVGVDVRAASSTGVRRAVADD